MATDIKISQMPSATTLEGGELIPIVQSSTNKTTTVNKIKEGLATTAQLENKVDKDGSKVLSEKNFTAAYETKLKGVAENANNYVHPTGNGNNHIPQDGAEGQFLGYSAAGTAKWVDAPTFSISAATDAILGGIKIGYTQSDKNYPIVLDSNDKAYVTVPWTDTTYSVATTSANGLMSAADKTKLDGLTNYELPAAGTSIGGVKQGVAVADATSAEDVVAVVNALLASLRTSGAIAPNAAAAASLNLMSTNTTTPKSSSKVSEPINFVPPMLIQQGKWYKEDGVTYECIQTSKLPISNKLKDLVGYYVKVVK